MSGGAAAMRFARTGGAVAAHEAFACDPEGGEVEAILLGRELARCASQLADADRELLAGIAAACLASEQGGSTRLPLRGPAFDTALADVRGGNARDARALLARAVSPDVADDPVRAVVGRPGERKPLIVDGDWLYSERMRGLEDRFCARVRERISLGVAAFDAPRVDRALKALGPSVRLTDEQRSAVRQAMRSPVALIHGGPGTGKTTAVVALVRALTWLGVPLDAVAIAAPTGKAAQRLSDAIAAAASEAPRDLSEAAMQGAVPAPLTLHRLLGWSPQRAAFAHHENDPLPHRLVIVDEASMIDLAMMDRLVRALRPEAGLVLLGDADQLPSVEAGAVFRDLCVALGGARLTANLRVASDPTARTLVTAARQVNEGRLESGTDAPVTSRRSVDEIAFEGVEHLDAPFSDVADALIERWWQRIADDAFGARCGLSYGVTGGRVDPEHEAEIRALAAHHARARILSATRVLGGDASADALNARILERMRRAAARETGFATGRDRNAPYPPGAPILVGRNDYALGLFNGDQGVVVDTADGPMVAFPRARRVEALAPDPTLHLAPAFAMTVHKAQGSEFDHVVLVLPERDLPILTRELVYTAVTRARRSVLVVGEAAILRAAIARTVARYSGVAEKLAGADRRRARGRGKVT